MKTAYLQCLGIYQFLMGFGAGALLVLILGWAYTGYHKKRKKFYFQMWVDAQQELFLNERKMEDAQLELSYLRSSLKERNAGNTASNEEGNAKGTMSGLEK
ncbi:MAG: hypothetical protein DI535_22775 [Citrobacter freundii]|nr:MAG: hypothetical protein DI535_22775 [Citrobacter freundii]